MTKWYMDTGAQGDVVISTRVRLARNLKGIPFPGHMSAEQRRQVNQTVRDALFSNPVIGNDFKYIELKDFSPISVMSMVERHLVSPEFAKNYEDKAMLLSSDESTSIMLCEEDHIRIQVMRAGLALDEAFSMADKLDTLLDSKLGFAFDERLGYLTECPTNLGTGLRASVMLHLPALEAAGAVGRLAATVSKIGLTIRGTYGEGSKAKAAMYQLSNQVTLGISEQTALDNLKSIASQAMAQERSARSSFDAYALEDTVYRALGILKFARSLSSDEFMELISKIRLGISMGIIRDLPLQTAEALLIEAGPAMLQETAGRHLDAAERDKTRAAMVRERLKGQ